jgi:hypothetical protein
MGTAEVLRTIIIHKVISHGTFLLVLGERDVNITVLGTNKWLQCQVDPNTQRIGESSGA